MTKIRPEVKNSKWKLSKHAFLAAYHYALQYEEWNDRYRSLLALSSSGGDGMPHSSGISNPTEAKGLKAADLSDKIKLIEDTAKETDPALHLWILKAVTHENITYSHLKLVMNIPCGKNMYYDLRRKFYYLLCEKLQLK